jgi:protein involved in polysaccharide export with SLBB domain
MDVSLARVRLIAGPLAVFFLVSADRLVAQRPAGQVASGTMAYAQTGDQLRITGWPLSAFGPQQLVVVDSRGYVVLPQVGDVPVGRIPIADLRDTLKARYAKYIREPEIDVSVLRRVTVNGAVLKPDIYFMDVSATLRDVIARAGGVNEEVGNKNNVTVVRDGVIIKVPNWETDTTETSVLRSGDHVLVGRRSWIEINIIPVVSLTLATASFLLSLRHP